MPDAIEDSHLVIHYLREQLTQVKTRRNPRCWPMPSWCCNPARPAASPGRPPSTQPLRALPPRRSGTLASPPTQGLVLVALALAPAGE